MLELVNANTRHTHSRISVLATCLKICLVPGSLHFNLQIEGKDQAHTPICKVHKAKRTN